MPRLKLSTSEHADIDIAEIELYSLLEWGPERASAYLSAISDSFANLQEYPEIGHERAELDDGLRALAVEHQVIFYRVLADTVRVLRVFHSREDLTEALCTLLD